MLIDLPAVNVDDFTRGLSQKKLINDCASCAPVDVYYLNRG
jgi:hypothetical protein